MNQVYLFLILLLGIGFLIPRSNQQTLASADELVSSSASKILPDFVTPIDAHGNGFTATLCIDDIKLLKEAGVRAIVRMNGNTTRDVGCMSIEAEAALCGELGIQFYYENLEGRIEAAGQIVANLMQQGGVVVHCRNGAHRAPAMCAYYLRKVEVPRELIIYLVGWTDLIKNPQEYQVYTDAVLPTAKSNPS